MKRWCCDNGGYTDNVTDRKNFFQEFKCSLCTVQEGVYDRQESWIEITKTEAQRGINGFVGFP
jgi:hypothetical protein